MVEVPGALQTVSTPDNSKRSAGHFGATASLKLEKALNRIKLKSLALKKKRMKKAKGRITASPDSSWFAHTKEEP